jgi:RHS repeat-associated protein
MRSAKLWVLLGVMLAGSFPALAQTNVNEEQGMKPYDSFHGGDLDSISMTNGGLALHIPLVSFPQRGNLDLSFSVYASSKQWRTRVNSVECNNPNDPNGCTPYWIPIVRGINQPQFGSVAVEGAYVTSSLDWIPDNECNVIPGNENNGNTVEYDWTAGITAPDGNVHSFGGGISFNGLGCPTPPYRALDASGILQSDANTIIMPNGTHFNFPTNGNPSFVDANGNTILLNSTAYTDTLGRSVPFPPFSTTSDVTNCPTGSAASKLWTVPGYAGGSRIFKLCYSNVSIYTTFGYGGNEYGPINNLLLTAIVLPDLTAWTFSYDHWGNITRVGFPTGGSISYTYALGPITCGDDTPLSMVVTSRTVDANDGTGGHTWTYSYAPPTMVVTSPPPDSNDTVHTIVDPLTGQVGCTLVDTQVQHFQGSHNGGTLLKTVATQYSANPNTLTMPGSGADAINVVPHQVIVTLQDGHSSKVVNTWDSGNTEAPYGTAVPVLFSSLLQRDEYDFSNTLVRSTLNRYLWQDNATYKTNNFLSLPEWSTVYNGAAPPSSTLPVCSSTSTPACIGQSKYAYDEFSPLAPSGIGVPTHVAPPAGEPYRGNLTTSSHWLDTASAFVSSTSTYFDTGMKATAVDPLNHSTSYTYSGTFLGAYLTQTNMPDTQMPDTGAPIVHHIISGSYDLNTGLLTSFTDENGQPYTYTYDSLMLRLTQGNHPDGGITKFFYPDPNTVERQRLITGTTYDDFKVKFDGLGRPYQTQQLTPDCQSYIKVDTTYDTLGRAKTVSNPYCLTSEATYGITTSDYDALSRTTKTTKQDRSFTTVKYEDTPGDTSGASLVCTTVTDESGKKRQTCSDAFGRLAKVIEPNPGAAATNATGWVTVSGTEQSGNSQSAVAASITVTIGGSDSLNTRTSCNFRGQCTTTHPADTGSMSFTVVAGGATIGPVSVPGGYNGNSNPVSLAAALYSTFPSNSSVTMSNPNGTATFTLTAASTGTIGNSYTIATSMVSACVPTNTDTLVITCAGVGWSMTLSGPNLAQTTVSPQNFSGGQNASSTPDTGNVTITINGTPYTTSFGSGDTSNTIAGRLATAISAGPYASATPSGGTVNLTSKTPGTAGDYSLAASYTWNSAQFTNPSFTTSTSGSALTGAKDASALNNNPFVTIYQYNARGDLLCVHQKATDTTADVSCTGATAPAVPAAWRQRFFTYDSLSRLLTAMNPEMNSTGSTVITYGYDNNSRLTSKTEPAPNAAWGSSSTVTVNYTYDALNRLLDTTYTDGTTQGTSHRYDYASFLGQTFAYPIGREVAATTAYNTIESFTSYDPMGRVASTVQCNPGVTGCKTFTAAYNKLGDLTNLAYPGNGFTVTYGYDSAARLTTATDSDGVIYAQTPTYLATGAIQEFTSPNFNNNKYHVDYNNRFQPTEIWAGPSAAGALFDKQYQYTPTGQTHVNNGNIFAITNVKDSTRTQNFTYDPLNRLVTAGDQTHWSNSYAYDAWGNLYQKNPGSLPGENMIKVPDANNHLSGLTYDAAGNVTNDGLGGVFAFDGENRIKTAGSVTYTYDADGRRIQKSTGTNYWYSAGGQVLAETDASGNWTNYIFFGGQRLARNMPQPSPNPADIKYYISDHLHSTAMFVDKAGTTAAILDDNDMYPWGGVVPGVGKTTSNNSIKFTGQYRDTDTAANLDYFGARYYSNTIGRFMSPDWAAAPIAVPYAKFGDPQSLNLYSYVENGPINRIDADGHSYAGVNGLDRDESAGVPMATWDDLDEDLKNKPFKGNPSPTPSPSPNTQSQDTGGFWQKLGNVLTGNGWKTNAQVIAEQRQWLIDHKVQQMDRDGNKKSIDWSKATDTQVTEAYKYIQSVYSAARSNKQLVELGLAATVVFGHGARHLEGSGLKQDAVESAIQEDVQATIKGATQPTTNFWGRVTVDGKVIEYRAYTLPSGTINVGTYYIP